MGLKENKDTVILLFSTLLIALCGLLYELMIGTASSYFLGNSVEQFSLTIGAFMTAFGIGSFLSRYFQKNLVLNFFIIETLIGFLGSICIISLFYFYSISDIYSFMMYFFIFIIGALVGMEIPLIGRIINEIKDNLRINLANLFSFDYIGGMVGSIALPLFLLPRYGLLASSILVGISNLFIALLVGIRFRDRLGLKLLAFPILLIVFNIFLLTQVQRIEIYLEQKFYTEKIVYYEQSKYQKIIVTHEEGDFRLYLDGNIQFSSRDEYRYHETLVHIPIAANKTIPERVLILGGGDGLAARELLKYSEIQEITICDLDPRMTEISRAFPMIAELNEDALLNPKIRIINQDAYTFLENEKRKWDLIVIDLPDPNNESLGKLYSLNFYWLVKKNLKKEGIAVAQSTSPFHSREVFWCIYSTIQKAGFKGLLPYYAEIPSFGTWGFIAFSNERIEQPKQILIPDNSLKFLNHALLPTLFIFPKDAGYMKVEPSTLIRPVVLDYYQKSWKNY